jgi:4-amino-4-deoxy-L-arabinose transferase-like glycosyltransferase
LKKQTVKKQESEAVRLRVKPGDQLSISIRVEAPQGSAPAPKQPRKAGFFARATLAAKAFFNRPKVNVFFKTIFSPMGLFILGCVLFTLTRFIRLPYFPLNFSSDEALTALRGLDLVRDKGFDYNHYFLPPLFINDSKYSLGTTVYLQILPLLAFGKSVWVVRGVSALLSLLGVIWFSLILRDIFKLRLWWVGAFLLGVTPAWFLFSRTAFETAQMTALYTGAIYYYLRYRTDKPKYLYISMVLAAMAFFAYLPGEVTVLVTLLAFALFDIRYHIRNWKVSLPALGVLVLLALPMANFVRVHPEVYGGVLQQFDSYLGRDLPVAEKALTYLGNYLRGLSPTTWYSPWVKDEPYYLMKHYGHILVVFLPLAIWGVIRLFKRRRKIELLTVLVPFFAAPLAAAIVEIQVTRVLVEIIPYSLVTMLGLEAAADWLEAHKFRLSWVIAGIVVLLSAGQIVMLANALTRGSTWWTNYGLSGMQYGSNVVFSDALAYSREHPDTHIYISGGWIFKADDQLLFFVPPDAPIELGTPDMMPDRIASGEDLTFVVLPEEYKRLVESGDYESIQVDRFTPCPDGSPCFRFIKLQFKPEVKEHLQAGIVAQAQPVETGAVWNGVKLETTLTTLSEGKVGNLFDGKNDTFIRSAEINPLVINLGFPQTTPLSGVRVRVGSEPISVMVTVNGADPQNKQVFTKSAPKSDGYKEIQVDFDSLQQANTLEIEVQNLDSPKKGFVHIWELNLLKGEEK